MVHGLSTDSMHDLNHVYVSEDDRSALVRPPRYGRLVFAFKASDSRVHACFKLMRADVNIAKTDVDMPDGQCCLCSLP